MARRDSDGASLASDSDGPRARSADPNITVSWDQSEQGGYKAERLAAVGAKSDGSVGSLDYEDLPRSHTGGMYPLDMYAAPPINANEDRERRRLHEGYRHRSRRSRSGSDENSRSRSRSDPGLKPRRIADPRGWSDTASAEIQAAQSARRRRRREERSAQSTIHKLDRHDISNERSAEAGSSDPYARSSYHGFANDLNSYKAKKLSNSATSGSGESIEALIAHLQQVQMENQRLQDIIDSSKADNIAPVSEPECRSYLILHRLNGEHVFFDEPRWERDHELGFSLHSKRRLRSLEVHLARNPSIHFVVYKDYSVTRIRAEDGIMKGDGTFASPVADAECISIASSSLAQGMRTLATKLPDMWGSAKMEKTLSDELPAPYIFIYDAIPFIEDCIRTLAADEHAAVSALHAYIMDTVGEEYKRVEKEFAGGLVSLVSMPYLIRPGEIIIAKIDSQLVGVKAETRLVFEADVMESERGVDEIAFPSMLTQQKAPFSALEPSHPPRVALVRQEDRRNAAIQDSIGTWKLAAWHWQYNGTLERFSRVLALKFGPISADETIPITELDLYPIRFASKEVQERLSHRGETFWKFGSMRAVSYQEDVEHTDSSERYIIDMPTYRRLHPRGGTYPSHMQGNCRKELGKGEPPRNGEELLFPPTITAFYLRRKRWVDIEIDRITDVVWNKAAFEALVITEKSKELIQALVTSQLTAETTTDFIQGKGNGLIILLHGGPGTGKTFTAESVSEMVEKPLYRISCGDIGTNSEEVEKYLESAFSLGKLWDCVVLLDEADVFLEERSMADLQRNALVSVFLRVLEYYSGILILTSNRVGTFDSAFKSRIQLALHYEDLRAPSRKKIWRNLMNHLSAKGDTGIDFDDIMDHLDDLAKEQMNGRQIRNAITTGRQLARFQKKRFCYDHLEHVIRIGAQFEKYLMDVQHMSEDDLARSNGLR